MPQTLAEMGAFGLDQEAATRRSIFKFFVSATNLLRPTSQGWAGKRGHGEPGEVESPSPLADEDRRRGHCVRSKDTVELCDVLQQAEQVFHTAWRTRILNRLPCSFLLISDPRAQEVGED